MDIEAATILVVDDDADQRELLAEVLGRAGHVVCCADSAASALVALSAQPLPDLVLLDLQMPDMDGLALLRRIRGDKRTAALPVIMVSGDDQVSRRVACLDAGANDFVTKPANSLELLARARRVLRAADDVDRLRKGSFLDPLTGLMNRLGVDHLLGLQTELAIRHHSELAVLFIDLDGFKRINDERGHLVGDRVLCDVARALESQLRASDIAARWGGDEFVIVLPSASPSHIDGVVHRLRAAVASLPVDPELRLDASIGIARLFQDVQPGDDAARRLLERADEAMYRIKHARSSARGHRARAVATR